MWQISCRNCHVGKMPYTFWLWQFPPLGIFLGIISGKGKNQKENQDGNSLPIRFTTSLPQTPVAKMCQKHLQLRLTCYTVTSTSNTRDQILFSVFSWLAHRTIYKLIPLYLNALFAVERSCHDMLQCLQTHWIIQPLGLLRCPDLLTI